jgi:hypothetical protein
MDSLLEGFASKLSGVHQSGSSPIIDCGPGASDEVFFDKGLDVTTNCEVKHGFS